jgi:hypothetical protein
MSGMRRTTRLSLAETEGYTHPSLDLTPEDLLAHWPEINDLSRQHLTPDTLTWSADNKKRLHSGLAG